jgi:hypothetical protein
MPTDSHAPTSKLEPIKTKGAIPGAKGHIFVAFFSFTEQMCAFPIRFAGAELTTQVAGRGALDSPRYTRSLVNVRMRNGLALREGSSLGVADGRQRPLTNKHSRNALLPRSKACP